MKKRWIHILTFKDGKTLLAASEVCLVVIMVLAIWRDNLPSGVTLILTTICFLHGAMLWRFISESKRAERNLVLAKEAADQANLTRGAFLSTMSHEIRTPMNAIVGMTELLRGTRLDSQQQEFAKTIEDSANALLGIINDVLDFSKIDVGKLEIAVTEFDLAEVVESCTDILSFKSREKQVRLLSHIAPNIPPLLVGDPGRIRQVLLNLIGNALKFTQQGEVVVRVLLLRHMDDRCRIRVEVSDTGIGIDAETIQRLFTPFSQADSSVTRKYGGTGLGLSICKRLIELMGGKIGVGSTLGQGSLFWFELSMPVASSGQKSANSRANSNLTVALIEPHNDCAKMVTDYLQSAGMQVVRFKDGGAGLAAITINQLIPTVVIVGYQTEEKEALALIGRIREAKWNTRCILLKHEAAPSDVEHDNSYDVLHLPLRRKQLVDMALGRKKTTNTVPENLPLQHLLRTGEDNILLVEDNTINQKVAVYQLNAMGYGADIANNGAEALNKLSQRQYGLILMDCQMPVLDGYETTRKIRKLEVAGAHVPIVAMTANAMTGDRALCLDAGMDDYLTKPLLRAQLAFILEKYLPRKKESAAPRLIDDDRLQELFGDDEALKQEMLELFLEHTGPLVDQLNDACAIEKMPMAEIQAMGHRLAGSCLNLGAEILGNLGRKIEVAADQENHDVLQQLARECLLALNNMRDRISGRTREQT